MSKSAKSRTNSQGPSASSQRTLKLAAFMRRNLLAFVIDEGMKSLDTLLEKLGRPIGEAIQIDVDTEAVVARIARRAAKEGRKDDTEEVVRNRQQIYHELTAPVVDYYAEQGLLTRVLGTGTVEEVLQLILSVLEIDQEGLSA